MKVTIIHCDVHTPVMILKHIHKHTYTHTTPPTSNNLTFQRRNYTDKQTSEIYFYERRSGLFLVLRKLCV